MLLRTSSRSRWPFSPAHSLMIALAPLSLTGCLKSSDKASETKALPTTLQISGSVLNAGGSSEDGVAVYLEDGEQPVALTDAGGSYSLNLDPDLLVKLQSTVRNGARGFRLYFEKGATSKAVSDVIDLGERGDKPLATVTLAGTATIEGRVLLKPDGRKVEPASAVSVRIGRSETSTDADGKFKIADVTSGHLTLSASTAEFAAAVKELDVKEGEDKVLDRPLVLFPETGVAGAVFLVEPAQTTDAFAGGHPFMRSFNPAASKAAKYIRYQADQTLLTTATWKLVAERFDFDFPHDGGNVLYYQFADEGQKTISDVQSLAVILDQFGKTQGLVIEDGSGRVSRRDVVVKVDLPAAAYRMRVAETTEQLSVKPWLLPVATFNYTFDLFTNPANGQVEGFGQRTLYIQYSDALGLLSPVFSSTVTVDLFPAAVDHVFKIDNGSPSTKNRLVRCDINVPTNAYEMRIWEVSAGSSSSNSFFGGSSSGGSRDTSNLWLAVEPYMFYTFTTPGMKTVYLQFRTREQVVSPVYQELIRVDPFPHGDIGFLINGGAPSSSTPHLDLTLIPPPTAVEFKVSETASSSSSNSFGGGSSSSPSYISLTSHFPYSVSSVGIHTLYVQYRTLDGDESVLYSQTITIEPYAADIGGFAIDGGAATTIDPLLNLDIAPPATAAYMVITEGTPPTESPSTWEAIPPTAPFRIFGVGPHTIFMRFKTIDGVVSPAIQRTIFFDPFPFTSSGILVNNNDATTTDEHVTLTLWAPASAAEMRLSADVSTIDNANYTTFAYTSTFTLPATAGIHKVYVQYRTKTGEESPVFFDEITKN